MAAEVKIVLHVDGVREPLVVNLPSAHTPAFGHVRLQSFTLLRAKGKDIVDSEAVHWEYLDDDNDLIRIVGDDDFQEALRLCPSSLDRKTLHLQVRIEPPANTGAGGCCAAICATSSFGAGSGAKSGCAAPASSSSSCCPSTKRMPSSASASGGGACCGGDGDASALSYCPPAAPLSSATKSALQKIFVPEAAAAVSRDPRVKTYATETASSAAGARGPLPRVRNATLDQYKYSGDALRAFVCPLGPNGGGCIALAGDGGLRQWQVSNRVAHDAHAPDSFFGIKVVDVATSKSTSVVLQSADLYDQTGFVPAAYITDHVVPPASIKLLQELPGVTGLQMTGRYPVMEVDYKSAETVVDLHLEAFNPCIPFNVKDSAIPSIIFNFTATNPTAGAVDVSLLSSLQNIAGWDGLSQITDEVCNSFYGGNTNALLTLSGLSAIDMSNSQLRSGDPQNGHVATAFLTQPGDKISTMLQYDSAKTMWQLFSTTGLPGQGTPGPSPFGRTWNGAQACTRRLAAGASTTFTIVLAWHFPNRFVNWDQGGFGIPADPSRYFIGNKYASYWPTVVELLEYVRDNAPRLTTQTRLLRDAMFDGNLPPELIDSAAGRIQPIRSPAAMWLADGTFYMFEGCSNQSGCCPLNCTHVLNYAQALGRLWPELEQTIRANDLDLQMAPNGTVVTRSTVPISLRRQWSFWPNCTDHPLDQSICSDGEIATVLKTYREVRAGANAAWFQDKWVQCQKIMERWLTVMDPGDGVVVCAQPSTYDVALFGANVFMGSLYLAALRAAEEMAMLQGQQALAQTYHQRFVLASANYDRRCFSNGLWYTQVVDPAHADNVLSTSTFVDTTLGQWWAWLLGLGPILPEDHVASTVSQVYEQNHVTAFDPARQYPRKFCDERDAGLYIATWGGPLVPPPANALLYTSEAAWTGVLYPFVGMALLAGLVDIALQMLRDARAQYDGTRRSPWNEIECGDHYTRQMAGFALFEIASGMLWDGPSRTLSFGPRMNVDSFQGFFAADAAFGQYKQEGANLFSSGVATLTPSLGNITLNVLRLASSAVAAVVTVDGSPVAATPSTKEEYGIAYLVLSFAAPLALSDGHVLTVTLA